MLFKPAGSGVCVPCVFLLRQGHNGGADDGLRADKLGSMQDGSAVRL